MGGRLTLDSGLVLTTKDFLASFVFCASPMFEKAQRGALDAS